MKLKLKQVYMLNLLDLKKLLFMTNFAEKKWTSFKLKKNANSVYVNKKLNLTKINFTNSRSEKKQTKIFIIVFMYINTFFTTKHYNF